MKNESYRRGDTVFITIKRRKQPSAEIMIDADDLPKVRSYRSWHLIGGRCGLQYARGRDNTATKTYVMLHRVINDTPADKKCTFINNDSFDCRKANLKNVDDPRRYRARSRSPQDFYIYKQKRGYRVSIWADGRHHYFGSLPTLTKAREVRDEALKTLRGKK